MLEVLYNLRTCSVTCIFLHKFDPFGPLWGGGGLLDSSMCCTLPATAKRSHFVTKHRRVSSKHVFCSSISNIVFFSAFLRDFSPWLDRMSGDGSLRHLALPCLVALGQALICMAVSRMTFCCRPYYFVWKQQCVFHLEARLIGSSGIWTTAFWSWGECAAIWATVIRLTLCFDASEKLW